MNNPVGQWVTIKDAGLPIPTTVPEHEPELKVYCTFLSARDGQCYRGYISYKIPRDHPWWQLRYKAQRAEFYRGAALSKVEEAKLREGPPEFSLEEYTDIQWLGRYGVVEETLSTDKVLAWFIMPPPPAVKRCEWFTERGNPRHHYSLADSLTPELSGDTVVEEAL